MEELSVSLHVVGEELNVSLLVGELSMSPLVEEQTCMWIPSSWVATCGGQSG